MTMPRIINIMLCIASLSGAAINAGPIEVDIFGDGSNKGFTLDSVGYGLQWMDFNINNHDSPTYRELMAELESGGIYEGWREANYEEVVTLWSELFLGMPNTETHIVNSDGYFDSRGLPGIGPSLTTSPELLAFTDITGFTKYFNWLGLESRELIGYFRNKHGDIDLAFGYFPNNPEEYHAFEVSIKEKSLVSWLDWLVADGVAPLPFYDLPLEKFSVMLVRETPVPLPGAWLLWLGAAAALSTIRSRSRALRSALRTPIRQPAAAP